MVNGPEFAHGADQESAPVMPRECRRVAPWKLSNHVWDIFSESARDLALACERQTAEAAPSASDEGSPSGLVDHLPSADRTWDWDSPKTARRHQPSSFHGGSVLVHARAPTDEGLPNTLQRGYERDPILEGDPMAEPAPRHRPHPNGAQARPAPYDLETSQPAPEERRHGKAGRLPFDSTRAGRRTDYERDFRPCLRQIPLPKKSPLDVDDVPAESRRRGPPRSPLSRSRDIITQFDPEFEASLESHSIRTFPHLRRSRHSSEAPRPSRRLLRRSDLEDTASRTMHYGVPVDEPVRTRFTVDRNRSLGADVINYRFSGGICPADRKLRDPRPSRALLEQQLRQANTPVAAQEAVDNRQRAQSSTSITFANE